MSTTEPEEKKSNLIDRRLFGRWAALWRYPSLVVEVAGEHDIRASEAARALLSGISAAHTPAGAFEALLGEGKYKAADTLLDRLEADRAVTGAELSGLRSRLAEARRRARSDVEVMKFELSTRALRAGMDGSPPEGLSVVENSLAEARHRLGRWATEVRAREAELQQALGTRLDEARAERDAGAEPDPEWEAWERSVALSIEKCRFGEAERLLRAGKAAMPGMASGPDQTPRRPVWPYNAPARDMLARLAPRQGGENEISRVWGPRPGDAAGARLLESLKPVVEAGGETRPDEVAEFVSSLDAMLGAPPRDRQVMTWQGGYSSSLYSLREPCVPRLAMCGEAVTLWLPRDPAGEVPEQLRDAPAVLAFHPDAEPSGAFKTLGFTSTLIFRLVGDPHRRANFIRWLGRQVKVADIMPATFDLGHLPEDEDGVRRYVMWLFDYHGIALASDLVIELIIFYSGARPHLLRALVAEIAPLVTDRDVGVTTANVRQAWGSGKFRDAATVHCLSPIASDPWLLTVLACVYLTANPDEEVTTDYIADWLSTFGYAGGHDIDGALQTLTGRGLLAEGHAAGSVWIPRSACTLLVREHMADLEPYILKQLNLLPRQTS